MSSIHNDGDNDDDDDEEADVEMDIMNKKKKIKKKKKFIPLIHNMNETMFKSAKSFSDYFFTANKVSADDDANTLANLNDYDSTA